MLYLCSQILEYRTMMENPTNIFVNPMPHAMRGGVYLGLLFSANFLLSTASNSFMQALTYVLVVVIVMYSWRLTRDFRDNESEGRITYYRAFSYVFLLFFFAALVSAVVKLVYLKYINTEYLAQQMEATEKLMQQFGLQEILKNDTTWKSIINPSNFIMQTIMMNTFFGAVLGLIYAALLKKKEPKE